jgi:hypothetical protein
MGVFGTDRTHTDSTLCLSLGGLIGFGTRSGYGLQQSLDRAHCSQFNLGSGWLHIGER